MTIYVSNNVDKEFVLTTLKDCYIDYLQKSIFKNKMMKSQIDYMNKYLKETYGIDLSKLCKLVIENIQITTQANEYKLTINDTLFIDNAGTLGMLMRLVDYGNTEIRGIHLFDKVGKYIQNKLQSIFVLHTLKQMKKD